MFICNKCVIYCNVFRIKCVTKCIKRDCFVLETYGGTDLAKILIVETENDRCFGVIRLGMKTKNGQDY